MTASDHPFDRAIALQPADDGTLRGATSDEYWNFVSPFGGVTAATALNAILLHPQRIGDPLSLTVSFAGPIAQGAFTVATHLLRSNRSTQHWSVQITQGEQHERVLAAMAVFAIRRPTWALTEAVPPDVPAPADTPHAIPMTGLSWLQRYDMRYMRGRMMEDNPDSLTYSWIRDAPLRDLDFASLVALCDAFLPRLFLRRAKMVAIGTVSLNIYFHQDAASVMEHGDDYVLGIAQASLFNAGFFDQQGQLWGREGKLLATTQQMVWYKE